MSVRCPSVVRPKFYKSSFRKILHCLSPPWILCVCPPLLSSIICLSLPQITMLSGKKLLYLTLSVCRSVCPSSVFLWKNDLTSIAPERLIFSMQPAFYLIRRNIERELKSKIFWGHLSNPNFKVFFIAISINKQARRLIFSMQLDFNLTFWLYLIGQ